jgi:AcrR family transcriptional regulator
VTVPTQAERTESTRAALIAAGRELFGSRGYAAVGTTELVAAAGVTRGALYHHFRDKRDLFRAVMVATEQAFVEQVGMSIVGVERPGDQLAAALDATLDACTDPQLARISFIDGPAVLGFEDWRAVIEESSLGLLVLMLTNAMEAGDLRRTAPEPLAQLLLGALNEAGREIAAGGDRDAVGGALRALLDGLRAEPGAAKGK